MKLTRKDLRRLIKEEITKLSEATRSKPWAWELPESSVPETESMPDIEAEQGTEKSFDIDIYGSPVSTSVKFVSSETPYDQTVTKLQIMPHGEKFEDVNFYGSTVDDLANEIISYLEPETSENGMYWFLDGDYEEFEQEFKGLIIATLKELGIDPESDEKIRTDYRDREHNPDYDPYGE
jgi:hypothetical protein